MSASLKTMPGGQPSTTQPIAGLWLSPKVVTRKRWPKVLNDIEHFPEKWTPVFRRKCDQLKKLERVSDWIKSKRALGSARWRVVARVPSLVNALTAARCHGASIQRKFAPGKTMTIRIVLSDCRRRHRPRPGRSNSAGRPAWARLRDAR